jgi:hypothetical protein
MVTWTSYEVSDSGRTVRVINSLESPTKTVDTGGGASKKKISVIVMKFIVTTFVKEGMNVNSVEVQIRLIIAEFPL